MWSSEGETSLARPSRESASGRQNREVSGQKRPRVQRLELHPAGLRHSKEVDASLPGMLCEKGLGVVPSGLGGLDRGALKDTAQNPLRPRELFPVLQDLFGGICLQRQIGSTSGLGVNGGCAASACSLPGCPSLGIRGLRLRQPPISRHEHVKLMGVRPL